jgi:hypothetical protein
LKKKILLIALVLTLTFSAGVFAASGINLVVNGTAVTNVEAKVINGTTYVPLRAVATMLGAEVGYDSATKTAYVNLNQSASADPSVDTKTENSSTFTNVIAQLNASTVKTTIKKEAEADWAGDYEMQAYQIKNQTEAYETLIALNIDSEVKQNILNKAHASWEFDFEMVLYEYENQLKAYEKLNN